MFNKNSGISGNKVPENTGNISAMQSTTEITNMASASAGGGGGASLTVHVVTWKEVLAWAFVIGSAAAIASLIYLALAQIILAVTALAWIGAIGIPAIAASKIVGIISGNVLKVNQDRMAITVTKAKAERELIINDRLRLLNEQAKVGIVDQMLQTDTWLRALYPPEQRPALVAAPQKQIEAVATDQQVIKMELPKYESNEIVK